MPFLSSSWVEKGAGKEKEVSVKPQVIILYIVMQKTWVSFPPLLLVPWV